MQDQQRLIGDTLALVNVVREAFGVSPLNDLPEASPGHAADCLFARALAEVGVRSVGGNGEMDFGHNVRAASRVAALWGTVAQSHEANTRVVLAPPQFARVIEAFDARTLPQYINDNE